MNWFDAVPGLLVTAAWLLVPGVAVSYLVGLRGIAAWGLAPITSLAMIASSAVVLEMAGVDWSALAVLVVCVAVALVVGVVAFFLRRRRIFTAEADPRAVSVAGFVGLLPGIVLGMITIVMAIGAPDTLNQTYDALFHYNALAYIQDSHQASSLTLSTLGNTEVPGVFYPAAWHDLGSLVMMSTGASIPVAANLVTVVATVVVWPLSCLLLARQLFGRHVGALAITGTLSVGFAAFPWDLLGFGVLWPNLLGMAFAPAALAAVFTVTRWVRDDAIGLGRGWLAAAVAVAAAALTHPNVLFSVGVLALFPIGARLGARAWELHKSGKTGRGVVETVGAVVLFGLVWWYTATTPAFANTRDQYWPPFETPANAVGDVLLNATHRHEALWILSIVVILGVFAARREWPVLRLILAGHLATTFLYVLTAAINRPDTKKFTGYWYNDAHRLAAMLPITAVPLAVGGILFIAAKILTRSAEGAQAPTGWRARIATTSATTLVVTLAAALVVVTGGLYPKDREARVAAGYAVPEPAQLVNEETQAFFQRIKDVIPDGAVVAGNPFNGSAMLWTLADRQVLFPHFRSSQSPEQDLIAGHLDDVAYDQEVCEAVTDLGIDYLLVGGGEFRTSDIKWEYYRGLDDPYATRGFELVESDGDSKLYRITPCSPSSDDEG
ncbi:MAG: DUF6541 family protein [Actinophytocola sp.]|uniref:DUF6541 family protein n=1 Tax=Actinophytocola sp. TaxID=1872138 RepID=UPI003C787140